MSVCVEIPAVDVVRRLAASGVQLRREGGGLVARGPVGPLFRSLAELRARRDDLVAYLRSRTGRSEGAPAA